MKTFTIKAKHPKFDRETGQVMEEQKQIWCCSSISLLSDPLANLHDGWQYYGSYKYYYEIVP